ncbi:MAG: tetratricopeptide repeat protein [Spartobacteria bacterium]|nr:tetratricopeptide repeat protein [Spartobacteria bacterium]
MGASRPDETPAVAARAAAEERARRIEVAFLEGVRARLPDHPAVVESLGCLYTEMGRYQDGLAADRRMVQMDPASPTAWYNLACSLALTGQPDDAFAALEKAVALGYDDAEWMQDDDDFAPIKADPRFARILAQLLARHA